MVWKKPELGNRDILEALENYCNKWGKKKKKRLSISSQNQGKQSHFL